MSNALLEAIDAKLDALLERAAGPAPRFLTVDKAAEHSSLSAKSIRRLIARGDLVPCRPCKGRLLIDRQELDALILSATASVRCGRGIR